MRKTVKGAEAQREEQWKGADDGGKELTFSNIKLKKRGSGRRAGRKGAKHDVENRVLLWKKRGKYENLPIVVYFSLAKASDRIRAATETVDEAIRIPVIENKRRTNATQPGKLQPKLSPCQII
jgi:hypothetical protein